MHKYFEVWAKTSQRVNSDGTIDLEYDVAQDNIEKYVVYELDEGYGLVTDTKEYEVEDFNKIAEDHPAPEWQNDMW